jgi:hypothetical protein
MKQLIVSVHGIRTFGGWQERLEQMLVEEVRNLFAPLLAAYAGSAFTILSVVLTYPISSV